MPDNSKNGLFSDVAFLNESAGAVIFGLIALPYILMASVLVAYSIGSKVDKAKYESNMKKISKKLIQLEKQNDSVKNLKDSIGEIKRVDALYLLKNIGKDIGSKEKHILKNNSTVCSCIYDKNGNIVAYAMYDINHNKCAYNILQSKYVSDANTKLYIMAKLDYNLEIIGEGIKLLNLDLKDTKFDNTKNRDGYNGSIIVSKNEYSNHLNSYNTLLNRLKSFMTSYDSNFILDSLQHDSEFDAYFYYDDKRIKNAGDDYDTAFEKYYSQFSKNIKSAITSFKEKYKADLSKHKFKIEVEFNNDEDGASIHFYHENGYKFE